MAPIALPRWALVLGTLLITVLYVAMAVAAWGGWRAYCAHPARAGVALAALAFTLWALSSDFNLNSGRREDAHHRWIFLPGLVFFVVLAWAPAYMDRHDLWVIDGDAVRYLGLLLFVAGAALRVWPMFALGRRFSGLVAIQPDHQLVTDGIYRYIRHPSYLGGLLALAGWVLVFRSLAGLLLMLPAMWLTVARIDAEEALLASEFGSPYAAYRQRTWRLLPKIY